MILSTARIIGLASAIVLIGCAATSHIREKLAAILPSDANVQVSQTCSGAIFPHAASFSVSESLSAEAVLNLEVDGKWMQASSFSDFIARDTDAPKGPGVGATLLDGKACLRGFSKDADRILFGESAGLYYRSASGGIVAVLFEAPVWQGVVFLQGR